MPDRQLPTWARRTKWVIYTLIYALILWEAWTATLDHPTGVVAAFGHTYTNILAWGVVLSTALALIGHLAGNWLITRAFIPWATTGALIYAVVLADRLVLVATLALALRIIELEVFARKQPRRHRFRIRRGKRRV